jgi:hypothetical protein
VCEQENHLNYDKGVLAEILEPIMGKGLIPADLETWKVRRRAIVPGASRRCGCCRCGCCGGEDWLVGSGLVEKQQQC